MEDLEDPTIDDQADVSCLIVNSSPPVSIRFLTGFTASVGDDHERLCGSVAVCGGYANGHESAFTPDKREVGTSTDEAAEAAAGVAARAGAGQSVLVDRVPSVDGVESLVVPAKADIGGGASV
jgi:hypothetical protein